MLATAAVEQRVDSTLDHPGQLLWLHGSREGDEAKKRVGLSPFVRGSL
jgi:hypothetical protein